jgi:release factor glutamine methyltransferase
LAGLVQQARTRFERAGITPDEAALDARLLARHVLGWDAAELLTRELEAPPPEFIDRFEPLVARRTSREPLAYITGTREFWNLVFEVSPAVLIPRPETELLVEAALELLPNRLGRLQVADVCTGSGCLAVALAVERPSAVILGTDISADALAVARRNAVRHQVDERIELLQSDLLENAPTSYDLIVSNPPYVPAGDAPRLQPEIREHEPAVALFAGPDGLDAIRRLVEQSVLRLKPGGFLIFEFGSGQDARVAELTAATPGLRLFEIRRDLQGIPRTATAIRE